MQVQYVCADHREESDSERNSGTEITEENDFLQQEIAILYITYITCGITVGNTPGEG